MRFRAGGQGIKRERYGRKSVSAAPYFQTCFKSFVAARKGWYDAGKRRFRMDKWQKRFFDLARLVATWSKDPSSQVGAVIVDDKKRIVSVGFNGLPIGVEDTKERLENREIKYELIVHAEANAILTAPKSVAGCTIYVYPYLPCSRCAGAIIQSGIKRVIVEDRPIPERWRANFDLAKTILTEAGVEVDIVPLDE